MTGSLGGKNAYILARLGKNSGFSLLAYFLASNLNLHQSQFSYLTKWVDSSVGTAKIKLVSKKIDSTRPERQSNITIAL